MQNGCYKGVTTMVDRRFPLYRPELEHESCGVGAIVDLGGRATHRTVDQALRIVERLAHRAGSDALGTTGDGVGIMTGLPHALFRAWAQEEGISLGAPGDYAAGMFFFPEDEVSVANIARIFERLAAAEGMDNFIINNWGFGNWGNSCVSFMLK